MTSYSNSIYHEYIESIQTNCYKHINPTFSPNPTPNPYPNPNLHPNPNDGVLYDDRVLNDDGVLYDYKVLHDDGLLSDDVYPKKIRTYLLFMCLAVCFT